MKTANDLRVTRTYAKLTDAFRNLLIEKNFDNISINDLCENAGIRRATFYTHFKDKYDFTDFIVKTVQRKIGSDLHSDPSIISPMDYFMNFVKLGVEHLRVCPIIFTHICESAAFPTICRMISDSTRDILVSNLEAARSVGLVLPADTHIFVDFINVGIIYTVLDWLRKRPPPDDELFLELEKILKTLFKTN